MWHDIKNMFSLHIHHHDNLLFNTHELIVKEMKEKGYEICIVAWRIFHTGNKLTKTWNDNLLVVIDGKRLKMTDTGNCISSLLLLHLLLCIPNRNRSYVNLVISATTFKNFVWKYLWIESIKCLRLSFSSNLRFFHHIETGA